MNSNNINDYVENYIVNIRLKYTTRFKYKSTNYLDRWLYIKMLENKKL